ncbi:MAG: NADH-quinone oxidoreductase subunit I [Deltaproteobacteria bacterium]|nr:NADH-quinone oxidoreductase subunit I [Deltaproteobacteria bacterium]
MKKFFYNIFTVLALFKGLFITLSHMFKKKVTLQYPEEKWKTPSGYRGFPRLVPSDKEGRTYRCVSCKLCEAICPSDAIYIEPNTTESKSSFLLDMQRYPKVFDIHMGRCIVCGLCEEACPVEAITLAEEHITTKYSQHVRHKNDLLLPKEHSEQLLRKKRALAL